MPLIGTNSEDGLVMCIAHELCRVCPNCGQVLHVILRLVFDTNLIVNNREGTTMMRTETSRSAIFIPVRFFGVFCVNVRTGRICSVLFLDMRFTVRVACLCHNSCSSIAHFPQDFWMRE